MGQGLDGCRALDNCTRCHGGPLVYNLITQKLKATLANPTIRRFLIHYFLALNLQDLLECYGILHIRGP